MFLRTALLLLPYISAFYIPYNQVIAPSRMNMADSSFLSAHNVVEYPNDDYSHCLGFGLPNYSLSRLQDICRLRLLDIRQSMTPIDTEGCGVDRSMYKSSDDLISDIRDFDELYGKPVNLYSSIASSYPRMAIAAEFKKASPSKGPINIDADPVEQCLQYADAGVSVISVLTEFKHFQGTLNDLKNVRNAVQKKYGSSRPAILRKDFILSRYQILEARASGADTVLLIVAVLGINQLKDLISFARIMEMEPLVEVNSQKEMELAIMYGAKVIGVNNRNLHNFQVDLQTTNRAVEIAREHGLTWRISTDKPLPSILVAALSGISTISEVRGYYEAGISCCLIGEALMKSPNPKQTIQELANVHDLNRAVTKEWSSPLIVKTCGYKSESEANYAIQQGANLIGVIFAEKSPRRASMSEAIEIVNTTRKYGERSLSLCAELFAFMSSFKSHASDSYNWFDAMSNHIASVTLRKPLVVGVFQDQTVEYINEIVESTGIDIVQLHGGEDSSIIDLIKAPCIKVIHLPARSSVSPESEIIDIPKLQEQIQQFSGKAIAILVDSKVPGGARGGTGLEFDWNIIEKHLYKPRIAPVLLAGGIQPSNVKNAISLPGVIGIDVSSGIELKGSPGVKDPVIVQELLKNAKQ